MELKQYLIDGRRMTTRARAHSHLKDALQLPDWYGRNLDALHDVLTEFGPRWHIVFRNAGAAMNGLRAVCEDAMAETPGLEIEFEN